MFAFTNFNSCFMKNIYLYTLLFMLAGITFISCSDSDDFNPFEDQILGTLCPSSVTFKKANDKLNIVEQWSNITRNRHNQITGYTYTRISDINGVKEDEKRTYTIDYVNNQEGPQGIWTKYKVDFHKIDNNGTEEKYTENIYEEIALNRKGYIETISTTTEHFDSIKMSSSPIAKSIRTFTYNGDFCTGSVHSYENVSITYKHSWSSYRLNKTTILKEDKSNNITNFSKYEYTYSDELYKYSGAEILPFIQSGIPQVYASMGYFGKFTPYALTGETQSGYTKYPGVQSNDTPMNNSYNFEQYTDGTGDLNFVISGISNIYDTYSVTFSK